MVLVVTGRNTPFIEHTYHRFMARFGPGWPRLMRLMSRLPWYRGSMKAFAHGAGLGLTVEVKEEGGWREAGWLPPVGITGDRAVAVPLKIRDKKAKLQLRLVALPGAWAIDEVFGAMEERAAVGGEALLKSRLLGVKRADHVHAGRSSAVSPARLSRANGRRARLVQGDHLTLSFGAPPPRPIHERTAVLRLTGYYEELSRSPKPCLEVARLTRCLAGEHCFARYTLEQLSRQRGRLPKKTGSSNMGVAGAGAKVH